MLQTATSRREISADKVLLGLGLGAFLLACLACVGIAAVGRHYFLRQREQRKASQALADVKETLTWACQAYWLDHNGQWPPDLETLVMEDEDGRVYLDDVEELRDPWGNRYQYDPAGPRNDGRKPDIWTQPPQGEAIGNWSAPRNDSREAAAFDRRGIAYYDKGDYDRAIKAYDEVIRLDPKGTTFYNRGLARFAKQDYDGAIEDYDQAIRNGVRNPDTLTGRGIAQCSKMDYDRALQDFDEAILLNPNDSDAFTCRGNAWTYKREYDLAIKDYNEAVRLSPNNAGAYTNRGDAWYKKKDYDLAIEDYGTVIRLDPKNGRAYHSRGNACHAKEDYDRAINDYDEALRLDPKDATVFYNRSLAWFKKKDYDRAFADADETIRLAPDAAYAFNGRAWFLATCPVEKHRDGKKAVGAARRACELSEWKSTEYMSTLAAAYAEAGEFENAVRWLKKSLEDPEFEKENGDEARKQLKLYEERKPYRQE